MAPAWLLEKFAERPRRERLSVLPPDANREGDVDDLLAEVLDRFPIHGPGERNGQMSRVIGSLIGRGYRADLAEEVVYRLWECWNEQGFVTTPLKHARNIIRANIERTLKNPVFGRTREMMDASQMEVMFGPVLVKLRGPIEWTSCGGGWRARLRTVIEFGIVRNFFTTDLDSCMPESGCPRKKLQDRLREIAEMLDDGRLTARTYLERLEHDPDGGGLFVAGLCPRQEEKITWPGECECCGEGCAVAVEAHDPLRLD
jgi:hypothetical protein